MQVDQDPEKLKSPEQITAEIRQTKLAGLSDDDLAKKHGKLINCLNALESNRYMWEQQTITNYLSIFTKDKYVLNNDGSISRVVAVTEEKQKIYVKLNRLFGIYRSAYAKMWSALPLIQAEPVDTSSKSEFSAELAETLLYNDYYNSKRNGLYSRSLMWYVSSGNAFCGTRFNKSAETNGIDIETNTKIEKGEVVTEYKNPFFLYFDPLAYSIEYSRYVFEFIIVEKDVFKQFYNYDENDSDIENTLKYRLLMTGDSINVDKSIDTSKYTLLIKYYEKPNALNPEGEVTLMTRSRILEIKPKWPFPKGVGMPFAQAKRVETGFAMGETPTTFSQALDWELALAQGQIADYAEKMNPLYALGAGSEIESKMLGNRRMKVVYYNQKTGKPEVVQPGDLPRMFYENVEWMKEDLADMNAIHSPSMGKREPGMRSGLQHAYMVDVDNSQHIPDIEGFYRMFEVIGTKSLKMKAHYYKKQKRFARLFGKDKLTYMPYKGDQLGAFDNVKIDAVAGLPLDRIQKRQALMELAAVGAITKQQMLKFLELGDIEQAYKLANKDRRRQLEEIDKIVAGEWQWKAPPKDFDIKKASPEERSNFMSQVKSEENQLEHIKETIKFLKSPMVLEVPDDKIELMWWHIKAHTWKLDELFLNDPLVATYSHDLENASEIDFWAIQKEVNRATAELGGQTKEGGPLDGAKDAGQQFQNKAQAVAGVGPGTARLS